MMCRAFILALLLSHAAPPPPTTAQCGCPKSDGPRPTGTIAVKAYDAETNEVLPKTQMVLKTGYLFGDTRRVSDRVYRGQHDGSWTFLAIGPGTYDLAVSKLGYETFVADSVHVEDGGFVTIVAVLSKSKVPRGNIHVTVLHEDCDAPFAKGTVVLRGINEQYSLDENGRVLITDLPEGPYLPLAASRLYRGMAQPDTVWVIGGTTLATTIRSQCGMPAIDDIRDFTGSFSDECPIHHERMSRVLMKVRNGPVHAPEQYEMNRSRRFPFGDPSLRHSDRHRAQAAWDYLCASCFLAARQWLLADFDSTLLADDRPVKWHRQSIGDIFTAAMPPVTAYEDSTVTCTQTGVVHCDSFDVEYSYGAHPDPLWKFSPDRFVSWLDVVDGTGVNVFAFNELVDEKWGVSMMMDLIAYDKRKLNVVVWFDNESQRAQALAILRSIRLNKTRSEALLARRALVSW